MSNNRKHQNSNWVLVLGILILIGSIYSLVTMIAGTINNFSSGNVGFELGRYLGNFGFIFLGGYCIYAYSKGIRSYDRPQETASVSTSKKTNTITAQSKDDEAISQIQTRLIKLGFKSINHIDISDNDLSKLTQSDVNKYYSAGKRVLRKGKL